MVSPVYAIEDLRMPVTITVLYTGILALTTVVRCINVTIHRFKYGVMIGDGGQNVLRRMVRIQGNSVENIPLTALLMALYEIDGGEKIALHAAASLLSSGGCSLRDLYGFTMDQAQFGRAE
jgi:hypothetical protein